LYIALPINAPIMVCDLVDGPIGMIVVFTAAVYLFLYANPILAVLFVFAGYELLRRCCNVTGRVVIAKHTPTQAKKDKKMKKMNPIQKSTLEEEVVQQMAPVGKSESSVFTSSTFSPVADNVGSASVY
jgi:hypothetical protein